MLKRWTAIVLSVIICVSFLSCKDSETEELAQQLYERRTDSVSDTEGVKELAAVLLESGYGSYTLDVKEHSLTVTFQSLMGFREDFTDHLYRLGAAFIALTGDCEQVTFVYKYNSEQSFLTEQKQKVTQKRAAGYVKDELASYAQSAEGVYDLLRQLKLEKKK